MTKINIEDYQEKIAGAPIENLYRLDRFFIGSKVEFPEQVEQFKAMGVEHAIDLKFKEETAIDEAFLFTSQGINYSHFPISDLTVLQDTDLKKFENLLDKSDKKTIIYCGSGNRVAGILALYLSKIAKLPKEEVFLLAQKIGMTKEGCRLQVAQQLNL